MKGYQIIRTSDWEGQWEGGGGVRGKALTFQTQLATPALVMALVTSQLIPVIEHQDH